MWTDLFNNLSLIDVSGYVIIGVILLTLVIAILVNLSVRARYALLERDLQKHLTSAAPLRHRLLTRLVRDAEESFSVPARDTNYQALIEHYIKQEMAGSLLAERFFRTAAGMMIVLGLVGTFYGLTLSIGKLVALITGDTGGISELTASLTKGLAGALSGMSVAFSTSLVGIVSAIIVMILGIFSNLGDKRNGLMLRLEVFLDNLHRMSTAARMSSPSDEAPLPLPLTTARKGEPLADLGAGVAALNLAVEKFDAALRTFSENTRDFQEFNNHLKDNIQRMSLGFAELTETLKSQARLMRSNGPNRR